MGGDGSPWVAMDFEHCVVPSISPMRPSPVSSTMPSSTRSAPPHPWRPEHCFRDQSPITKDTTSSIPPSHFPLSLSVLGKSVRQSIGGQDPQEGGDRLCLNKILPFLLGPSPPPLNFNLSLLCLHSFNKIVLLVS